MKTELDRIVEENVSSCKKYGGINHLEGPNLPSQRSIACIVREFESLIFPGFHDDEVIDELNMKYVVGQKIAWLTRNLIIEIERSFAYRNRTEGKKDAISVPRIENVVIE